MRRSNEEPNGHLFRGNIKSSIYSLLAISKGKTYSYYKCRKLILCSTQTIEYNKSACVCSNVKSCRQNMSNLTFSTIDSIKRHVRKHITGRLVNSKVDFVFFTSER